MVIKTPKVVRIAKVKRILHFRERLKHAKDAFNANDLESAKNICFSIIKNVFVSDIEKANAKLILVKTYLKEKKGKVAHEYAVKANRIFHAKGCTRKMKELNQLFEDRAP